MPNPAAFAATIADALYDAPGSVATRDLLDQAYAIGSIEIDIKYAAKAMCLAFEWSQPMPENELAILRSASARLIAVLAEIEGMG